MLRPQLFYKQFHNKYYAAKPGAPTLQSLYNTFISRLAKSANKLKTCVMIPITYDKRSLLSRLWPDNHGAKPLLRTLWG